MLPVLPVLRAGASCRYRLRLGPQPTHMVTGSTRARPLRLRVRACRALVPMRYYATPVEKSQLHRRLADYAQQNII